MKNQLEVTCYFISLIMRSTCFGHYYIHLQEPATLLKNYHIGRIVLSLLCVGVFAATDIWWCSFCSASTCKTNTTKYQSQQKLQHTTNWKQYDRCGNSSTKSQALEDEYSNVRNMLSAQ